MRACRARDGSPTRASTGPSIACAWRVAPATMSSLVARSQTRDRDDASPPTSSATRSHGRAPGWRGSASGRGDRVAAYLPNVPEAVVGAARHRVPWRDLVELRAGVRDAQRGRSAQPDRAEGAADDRRLSLRRARGRSQRRGGRHPRRAAQPGGHGRRSPTCGPMPPRIPDARDLGGAHRRCRASSPSSPCRSTTRCSCSTARARPACRSRSSTATAGSCSSTSRSTRSTTTSAPRIGSSGSAPPAG